MWHAVGSSPLNRFFITLVTFGNYEPVRVRQGRQIAISAAPKLMPRPPFRRSSPTLRLIPATYSLSPIPTSWAKPLCTLGSKSFTRKHNLHCAPHSHSCRHTSHVAPTPRGIADIAASTFAHTIGSHLHHRLN